MSFAKCSQNVRLMGLSGSRLGVVQETFFNAGWVTTRSHIRHVCYNPLSASLERQSGQNCSPRSSTFQFSVSALALLLLAVP